MKQRVLIAGIGNIFLGDDGFGVEVAKRLASEALPDWVRVTDFGIRGLHLAYELLDIAYETTILVDVTPRGGTPGTVYLIEPDRATLDSGAYSSPDAHGMHPAAVFSFLRVLGGTVERVLIVGCEPARTAEEIGLSEPVARAVPEAVTLILDLIQREGPSGPAPTQSRQGKGLMHEFGLCEGIVDAIQRRAAGRPVARVRVRIGVLHRVVAEAFQYAFAHAASGTEAEHAAVDLVILPVRAVCRLCQAEVESDDALIVCPQCGGVALDLIGGDELILEWLEYQDPVARSR